MINYTRVITDEEQRILENDLLSVTEWINKAIEGKINNCMKRAARQYEEIAKKEDIALLPAKDKHKAQALINKAGYLNRKQRETRGI